MSLATGWLAGSLGGAKRIVVSQLAGRRHGEGLFQRLGAGWRAGDVSAQPGCTTATAPHFREIASFKPFDGPGGTRVATTSTTTGANLLVSGVAPGRAGASVLKYEFIETNPVNNAPTRASRTSLLRKGIAACHSGRRLI